MRTTITIDERLLGEIRRRAAERGITISQFIEDGVRESLLRRPPGADAPFRVRTFRGGARPDVDLDDNAALLDVMDDRR